MIKQYICKFLCCHGGDSFYTIFIIKRTIESDFKQAIGAYAETRAEVAYAFQDEAYLPSGYQIPSGRKKMLGTVQALLAAKDIVCEPFAIINADDYYGREAYITCAKQLDNISFSQDKTAACMIGYKLKNTISCNGTVNRGICHISNGKLTGVTETYKIMPDSENRIVSNYGEASSQVLSGESIVSMNFWGFQPSIFKEAKNCFDHFIRHLPKNDLTSEYVLSTMIDELIHSGRLHVEVLPCNASWMGITYPSDREEVSQGLRTMQSSGVYPPYLK